MKEKIAVICPGRGTYNAGELGYLKRHHPNGGHLDRLDALRRATGQIPVSQLDGAEKFSPTTHMTGDNASLLIYACALADFAAIDRERYEIVAVSGNSMGWYLALSCAAVIDFEAGARLVNNMGTLMHEQGVGGQIIWSMADAEWRMDPEKQKIAREILHQAETEGRDVHVSIHLGGMIVFAADDAGLKWLMEKLPKDDRFPMRLNHHAAFHSPLLDHIVPVAKAQNPQSDFGQGNIPLVDGTGRIWSPHAFDPAAIFDYTLGYQINRTYDFTRAVQVMMAEFAPDRIVILGPGTTMGAPVAQSLIESGWRGLSTKGDFQGRQKENPPIISMGMDGQRVAATG